MMIIHDYGGAMELSKKNDIKPVVYPLVNVYITC